MMWNDEDPIDEDPMTQLIFGVQTTVNQIGLVQLTIKPSFLLKENVDFGPDT